MTLHRRDLMQSSVDPALAATMLAQAERLRQSQAREMMALARAEARLASAQSAAAAPSGASTWPSYSAGRPGKAQVGQAARRREQG